MTTILITGCSSGFGLETARFFLDRDWTVIATMRTPREGILPLSDRLRVLPLDVTDAGSIERVVEAAGPIDVLVNNAGVGLMNALEGVPIEKIRELFETNTIGTIAMTQAVLPQFRKRGAGTIVNVTSSVTLRALPLLSAYTATKAAVNAFTESLALELEPLGIFLRLVLPGASPETAFGANARARMGMEVPEAYAGVMAEIVANRQRATEFTRAIDVAEAVWRAATDHACPMRLPAGADALAWSKSV
ncbi:MULTISPECIES: SDR family oxidoreductase [unclassified Shinella]|uniref:SDR family oxidoreductase n=1 Tax=unclassified Shinella TaxID=2643062 RepID=UPI00225CEA28|nr:SDR family oxidoreductase [Shinella sp. YE25]MDC7254562.1 SDR family oxidoreductase [Shinella sp. YE25]CAI0337283.1 Short-chain dehydrogenase/reductase [Rhizobiaceae bacterium]CAK7255778.1 Short-chain dehydrogenase/reductase [Shinella sp. WSC3-e]